MRKLLFTIAMLTTISSFATNYYVNPTGSNSNDGLSPATAKDDIENAGLLTAPGDTVFVMNGTYTWYNPSANVVNIYNSGTANNWIVFINYPGHQPIIKSHNWAAIGIQGADYIEVNGFEIIGNADSVTLAYAQSQQTNLNNPITSGNGIGCAPQYGNPSNLSHHIIIRNCKVSKCPGGGIYTNKADYIRIENNIVSECAWYAPYGNSGISLYQNWNSDSSTATKNFVIGNTCYRNENYIPFFAVGSITDGNGIIIDDGRNTQNGSTLGVYVGNTFVANNLVFDNGGRGIHCYESDKVTIVNNTCYKNCQSPAITDGEFTAYRADSISFINNIALPDVGIQPIDKSNTSTTNLIVDHNLWAANSGIANPFGTNTITTSANFVLPSSDPLIANFHIKWASTAINAGTHKKAPGIDKDGNIRSALDSIDAGCYEYQCTNPTIPSNIITTGGIAKVCPGESRTYTVNANAGLTYNWTIPSGATINSGQGTNSISVAYNAGFTTAGTLSVVKQNTCGISPPRNITISRNNPTAIITPQSSATICAGDSVILQANSGTGLTYQWKRGTTNIGGATLQNYTAKTGGTYKVIVTNANACSKTSAGKVVTVNCRLSNEVKQTMDMKLFPNPTNGLVILKFTSNKNENCELFLMDISGREMMREQVTAIEGENEHTIDISNYANGVYLMKVKNSDGEIVQKILKD